MPGRAPAVVFRVDATRAVGFGHFFRCLALANAFRAAGWSVAFAGTVPDYMAPDLAGMTVIGPLPGGSADWNMSAFRALLRNADLLITDMYAIDAEWRAMSPLPVLAVADDPLAVGGAAMALLPTWFGPIADIGTAPILTAPDHVLVRDRFRQLRAGPKRGGQLLVNCGGGDDRGLTLKVLQAMGTNAELRNLSGTVVLGTSDTAYCAAIEAALRALPGLQIRSSVRDMAELVAAHDWAVGCPAGAALERACLGLAQLLVPIADNQLALGEALAAYGAAWLLPADAEAEQIAARLATLLVDVDARYLLATAGYDLIDGLGAARTAAAAAALLKERCL